MKKSITCVLLFFFAISLNLTPAKETKPTNRTYAAWSADQFEGETENPSDLARKADPDGDGLSNILEYALDSDPLFADAEALPDMTQTNETLSLTFLQDTAKTDIRYVVEFSTDLVSWSRIPSEVIREKDSYEERRATLKTSRQKGFVRLAIYPAS
ncbi:MAG: hypothetical protein AAF514_16455 [Verrucomicrobiota bacterium]